MTKLEKKYSEVLRGARAVDAEKAKEIVTDWTLGLQAKVKKLEDITKGVK